MTGVLLYQPSPRWPIGAALGAAALIHLAAIAVADRHDPTQLEATPPSHDDGIHLDFPPPDAPIEESTPPPEDVAAPTPIPVPSEDPILDERAIPSPVRKQLSKPIASTLKVRSGVTSGTVRFSSVRAMALSGPRPVYPYEARRQKITGSGVAMMTVDPATGYVIDVVMQVSTGSPVLDNAAVTAFRRWRFKPGTPSRIRAPITYTLTGAAY